MVSVLSGLHGCLPLTATLCAPSRPLREASLAIVGCPFQHSVFASPPSYATATGMLFIEQRKTIVQYNLAHPFYESSLAHPGNLALTVGDSQFTYAALRELVQPLASWLRSQTRSNAPRVGILASRSPETYFGILGTCWTGGTYIPLSPKYPEERLLQHFERIALDALIVDSSGMPLLTERVLNRGPRNILALG